jgi:hypothetical protein
LRHNFIFLFTLLFTTASGVKAQKNVYSHKKEDLFVITCKAIVGNFYNKNLGKLNLYVHPGYGFYTRYRQGAIDNYRNDRKLDNNKAQIFDYFEISKPDFTKTPFEFGVCPHWNCDDEKWDKTGFIADSTNTCTPISTVAEFLRKNEEIPVQQNEIEKIGLLEGKCRKIVFAGTKETGIIFYLAWINNKWYLAVIDLAAVDCSA